MSGAAGWGVCQGQVQDLKSEHESLCDSICACIHQATCNNNVIISCLPSGESFKNVLISTAISLFGHSHSSAIMLYIM